MDNIEKLATQVLRYEEKQFKNTTQYLLDITMRNQTQLTQIRHVPSEFGNIVITLISYKQLEVKTNRTSFSYGNRYVHHNAEGLSIRCNSI
jgi:hypothetical protein